MGSPLWPTLFTLFAVLSCHILHASAFNITYPPNNQLLVSNLTNVPWTWDQNLDTPNSPSGQFEWVLFHLPANSSPPPSSNTSLLAGGSACPSQEELNAPSNSEVFKSSTGIADMFDFAPNPTTEFDAALNGSMVLFPKRPGDCVICVYGNIRNTTGGSHNFTDGKLMFTSEIITVLDKPPTTSTVTSLAESSTSTSTPSSDATSKPSNQTPIIIGAILGTSLVVLIGVFAVIYCRRVQYRRRVTEFHRDRMIFRKKEREMEKGILAEA
ncbi:hypothetical protein V5O48_012028 [Marasmius crinis-equi]|uniref:Uncharacterized protein n=1 Tax=Marasmius crinis-equi TaxID=585013 RepID=A0ABR3F4E6_9AGAR